MDPYDSAAVRQVWQRVRQIGMEEAALSDPQILAELIAGELGAQQTYRRLAAANRQNAAVLQKLAAEEGEHARRLRALYFLLYGTPPYSTLPQAREMKPLEQSIRDVYRAELDSVQRYTQMAVRWTEHSAFFRTLAQEEDRHAAVLRQMAAQFLKR